MGGEQKQQRYLTAHRSAVLPGSDWTIFPEPEERSTSARGARAVPRAALRAGTRSRPFGEPANADTRLASWDRAQSLETLLLDAPWTARRTSSCSTCAPTEVRGSSPGKLSPRFLNVGTFDFGVTAVEALWGIVECLGHLSLMLETPLTHSPKLRQSKMPSHIAKFLLGGSGELG